MMKKLGTLLTAAVVLALTAGCSAPAEPAEAPTTPPPTSQYSGSGSTEGPTPNKTMWDYQAPAMKDKAFYLEARKGTTAIKDLADDKLTVMSQLTCAALGNGQTSKVALLKQAIISATGSEDGLTAAVSSDLEKVLSVGTRNYCPDLTGAFAQAT
ncbi:hypothetical protein [Arthrobacter sp. UYCo732]|uniref:hypothetical protein n=1 Tax=Arthrobacter sp. UYCo732 TaxID=3156336 RepID=UPI003393F573